jgi:hypothetical protein
MPAKDNFLIIWSDGLVREYGYKAVDYTESDELIESTGIIRLQNYGCSPGEACYRNITIMELQ